MAVFDREQRRFVVRVVYDGPEYAGKTTNLRQLCHFFTTRRSEMETPVEIQGRTAYFDWLTIEGGFVSGLPLFGQLLTVPGQAAREPRRLHLLRSADVVVFVVNSTPEGAAKARPLLAALREIQEAGGRSAPALVLQANHQDRPEAIPPAEVAAALGLPADVPVIGARAYEGTGVRETAVVAMRAAIAEVQRRVLAEGVDALAGPAQEIDALLDALLDPDLPRGSEPAAESRRQTIPAPVPPSNDAGVTTTMVASSRAPRLRSVTPSFPMPAVPRAAPPREEFTIVARGLIAAAPPAPEPKPHDDGPETRRLPPLPGPDLPSGFVWPAVKGRELLRQVAFGDLKRRDDLVGQHGVADGSGSSDAILFEAGEHFLKTSPRRRFADADDARAALVRLARQKTQLGALLPERTVLAVQGSPEGSFWLWTVAPWHLTLRASMNRAAARADLEELSAALGWFARAAAQSAWLAGQKRLCLDVSPSNFALLRGDVLYLDDDIGEGAELPALGHAVLQRFEEYAAFPAALAAYADALEEAFTARLSRADAEAIGLHASIRNASPRSAEARAAGARLLDALARLG